MCQINQTSEPGVLAETALTLRNIWRRFTYRQTPKRTGTQTKLKMQESKTPQTENIIIKVGALIQSEELSD